MQKVEYVLATVRSQVTHYLDEKTKQVFDVGDGKLRNFPHLVLWLVYLMSLNIVIQGLADLVLKFAGYTPWIVQFPWRMDFLFLTAISVLMGYQTLVGIRRRELDVTRNSVQIGLLVEIALVVGDFYFVVEHGHEIPLALAIRFPFMVFTTINIFILLYVIKTLRLFRDEKGKWKFF